MSNYFGPLETTGGESSASFDGSSDLDRRGHKVFSVGHSVVEGDGVNLKYDTKELGATKRGVKGDPGDV